MFFALLFDTPKLGHIAVQFEEGVWTITPANDLDQALLQTVDMPEVAGFVHEAHGDMIDMDTIYKTLAKLQ